MPAPAMTLSAASERMPPTTGTAALTADLASRTAWASAWPAMAPLTVRKVVKRTSSPLRTQTTTFFSSSPMVSSTFSSNTAPAAATPM